MIGLVNEEAGERCDTVIEIPPTLLPMLAVVTLPFLAYYIGCCLAAM